MRIFRPDLFKTVRHPVRVVPDGLAEGQTVCATGWHAERLSEWNQVPVMHIATEVDAQNMLRIAESLLAGAGA